MHQLNKNFSFIVFCVFLLLLMTNTSWSQTRGKIAGQIVEEGSNEPMAGANVIIEGTQLGAAADQDGFYYIINIPSGVYTVKVMMVGYATVVSENVSVNINQTTPLNFTLKSEAFEGETINVTASRPVVQMDVASSQKVLDAATIQSRPLENFEEVLSVETGITLTAGQEGTGFIVRGGGLNETDITVDGLSTRNERNQQPMTNLSLTAIQEVEILTGGFNAEYSDIRSGMISVVTKEGSPDRFAGTVDVRVSPPARKHFGPSPYAVDGPIWQVYAGADAFTGVSADQVATGQYPFEFIGWNEISRQFLADPDPTNDMTPQALLELWKWQHRRIEYADKPDYILDMTFSGPVPGSNITWMLSQRYEDLQLAYPMSRKNSIGSTTLLKLTTYLSPTMKLSWNNMYMLVKGVSGGIYEDTNGLITGSREGTQYAQNAFYYRYIFADANFNPVTTNQYTTGLSLNHVLSSKTYYDVRLEYTNYNTRQEPIGLRDTTGIKEIAGQWYDETPSGYFGSALGSITESYDIVGQFLMSGGGRGQDHSRYWGIRMDADMVSQVDKHNQFKFGVAFDYTSFAERREINHGATTQSYETVPWLWWHWDVAPVKLGAYIQDKLEYEGMIATVGLRMDYLYFGENPYNLDPNFIYTNLPYTLDNFRADNNSFNQFTSNDKSYKLYWSPRIGVSHPVTETSKIFFNYGHFYQPPVTNQLYTIQPNNTTSQVPNLIAEWPRTISYELGWEQSLASNYLIHFGGYYKDVSDELSSQSIVAYDNANIVNTYNNNSYADIRGLELKLERRSGLWWYGFVNLEYLVRSTGLTGYAYIYQDPQLADQESESARQTRGWPVPRVNANLTFFTPPDLGTFFGDWRLNVLFTWEDGGKSLLNPDAPIRDQHYADVINYHNTDFLLEKRFEVGSNRLSVYMQVRNLFNYKGFPNPFNYTKYVDSLHFPWETGSQHGNDKLGETNRDYIELGWNTWSQFINPRDIFFGVKWQF
jgi:outer membrane receptor protein involved in Fe transport